MSRLRKSTIFSLAVLAVIAVAVIVEGLRPRPAVSPSISSQPPERPDEVTRLEGGFFWSSSDGQRRLFELAAESLVGTEGGAHFLEKVSPLTLHLEDGRTVTIHARGGRLQEKELAGHREAEIDLTGEVVVEDPDGVQLLAEKLTYDSVSRLISSDTGVRVEGPGIAARAERLSYNPDLRTVETEGRLEIDYARGQPGQVDAAGAIYRIDAGEVELTTPFVVRTPGETIFSGPGVLHLKRPERPAHFSGTAPVQVTGLDPRGSWQLAAWRIEAEGTALDASSLAGIEVWGPSSLVVRRATPTGEDRGAVRSPHWTLAPEKSGRGWLARGGPGFDAQFNTTQRPGEWYITGDAIEVSAGGDERLERLVGSGRVVARGPDEISAEAETVTWLGSEPKVLRLEGAPARTRQRGDMVEAPLLRLLRDEGALVAERGVIAEVASVASAGDSVFTGKGPVHVKGSRAVLPQVPTRPVVFSGPVQAWQGETILRSSELRLYRAENRLVADGSFVLRLDLERPGQPRRTLRLSGESLEYLAAERRALVRGGARFEEGPMAVDAAQLSIRGAEGGGIEYLEGEGAVRLVSEKGTANADRLVWEGGETGTILLIGEKELVTVRSAEGAITRGERVRYYLADGHFQTEGGSGRAVIEGKPGTMKRNGEDRK